MHRVSACLLQVKAVKPIVLRCSARAAFGQIQRFAMWSASRRTQRSAMAGGSLGLLHGWWLLWLCLSCSCQSIELVCCCALAARMRTESKNPNSCCNPHMPDAPFCDVSSRPYPTNTLLRATLTKHRVVRSLRPPSHVWKTLRSAMLPADSMAAFT